ncbi:MAG TPA: tetratricopeptide repeat protein [Pirellulaceae bacterium]|nr:tetratricopeptide repeat protein [Pirellulaceae bacterium]
MSRDQGGNDVDIKRQLSSIALCAGIGAGLIGCRSSMGGLAFWNSKQDTSIGRASPDVGKQKYDTLAKEFSGSGPSATALGGRQPAEEKGFAGVWKSTTSSVAGVFSSKSEVEADPDVTRLDAPSKKVGPEVHLAAAQLLENQSKFEEAEEHYAKALKVAPNDLHALVGLARMYDRQGQAAKSQQVYERALKAHPKSALVYNDLGLCYARQRDFQRSLGSLGKAVELQPDNVRYRNNLATVLVEAGRTDEALALLCQTGSEAVAHYNVGYLLHKQGNAIAATQHMQRAIALDPGLTAAREMLAQWQGARPMSGGEVNAATVAARPRYDAYGAGVPAAPISIQIPSTVPPRSTEAVHVDDGASFRLPPVK